MNFNRPYEHTTEQSFQRLHFSPCFDLTVTSYLGLDSRGVELRIWVRLGSEYKFVVHT